MSIEQLSTLLTPLPSPTSRAARFRRRQGWVVGIAVLLVVMVGWRSTQVASFGGFELRTITAGTMALAFLAMAQAVVVISGGIDLSVGAVMVLTNCIVARLMDGHGLVAALLVALLGIAIAMLMAGLMAIVITLSGVPDIVVTLAASFVFSGAALLVLAGPGGGSNSTFQALLVGGFTNPLPSVLWIAGALLLVWLPYKRSRPGLATYAVGSNRPAAFLSGIDVPRARVRAYAVGGFFSGVAGVVVTALTGSGEPRASIGSTATLTSVAAVVLGGVALVGGSGSLLGPVLAAMALSLIPALMLGLGYDPNYAEVARGVIVIVVVMLGGLLQVVRKR